jgi:hypothetical protein
VSDVSTRHPAHRLPFQMSSGRSGRCTDTVCWEPTRRETDRGGRFTETACGNLLDEKVDGVDTVLLLLENQLRAPRLDRKDAVRC